MHISKIQVNNFRNLATQTVELSAGLNVFVGDNAQGKTNLLEAIYLSSLGKSARTEKDKELINYTAENAFVKTAFKSRYGFGSIHLYLSKKEKKRVKVNEVPITKLGELLGYINCIYFSPDELKIIKASPIERRRLLDIDLCQLDKSYYYALTRFNKALLQRNNLLKLRSADTAPQVEIWNSVIAKEGAKLINKRREFALQIDSQAKAIHLRISGGELLSVKYECNIEGSGEKEIEMNYLLALQKSYAKDVSLGYTTVGCQRDDLAFTINDIDIRSFGSQGQQRSVALSIKLSELNIFSDATGEFPILLLDDVLSELDTHRQQQLLNINPNVQIVITTTNIDHLHLKDAKVFNITNGVSKII